MTMNSWIIVLGGGGIFAVRYKFTMEGGIVTKNTARFGTHWNGYGYEKWYLNKMHMLKTVNSIYDEVQGTYIPVPQFKMIVLTMWNACTTFWNDNTQLTKRKGIRVPW